MIIILIGYAVINLDYLTKVDLESQREVPTVEGMALAQIWGCSFVESSAKNRTNVNEVRIAQLFEQGLFEHRFNR